MRPYFILLLITPWSICAQDTLQLQADLERLASPEFAGRGYVEQGGEKAAAFIAQRFSDLGLEKVSGSYFQEYAFAVNTFPSVTRIRINGRRLDEGSDFIVDPRSGNSKGKFNLFTLDSSDFSFPSNPALPEDRAPIVFTRGIENPEEVARLHEFTISALEKGPVILVRPDKLTWSVGQHVYPNAIIEIREKALLSEQARVAKVCVEPEEKQVSAQNVIGKIKGKSSDSLFVFTAHYDHLGKMGKALFPGASDNASGTAMLLDLAAYFSVNTPPFDMVFIAFSGEEAGLLGSRFFVENSLIPLERIKLLINLDLMGSAAKGITVVNGRLHEREMKKMAAINSERELLPKIRLRGKAANSDHYWFSEIGVPAIFIYTEGNIGAYHDVHDTPEVVDWENYREVFTLLVEFVKIL